MSNDDTGSEQETAPALKTVGDESRLGIVQALVEHRREHPDDTGLSFSDLREAVGMRDSGRFNYHLDKLRGQFVEEGEDGYKLTYAGDQIAAALVSGEYQSGVDKGPVEHGTCPLEGCDATLSASYEDGYVLLGCADDDTVFRDGFPPAAAKERSMDELLGVVARRVYDNVGMVQDGICPHCYGTMGYDAVFAEELDAYVFRATCNQCGTLQTATPGICAVTDPAVRAFYRDHGTDIYDVSPWDLDVVYETQGQTVASEDPLRLEIDLTVAGDTIRVTVNDAGQVVETARPA